MLGTLNLKRNLWLHCDADGIFILSSKFELMQVLLNLFMQKKEKT